MQDIMELLRGDTRFPHIACNEGDKLSPATIDFLRAQAEIVPAISDEVERTISQVRG